MCRMPGRDTPAPLALRSLRTAWHEGACTRHCARARHNRWAEGARGAGGGDLLYSCYCRNGKPLFSPLHLTYIMHAL